MSVAAPPRLGDRDWFRDGRIGRIFDLLSGDGGEARIVGGAVRDALLGVPVKEVDFATTLRPEVVTARAEAAGLRAVPTGFEHGTVTLVVEGRPFEITTLRSDVETDGRHAVVAFGDDWLEDARRRDFTLNTLMVDSAGVVHDPLGGYDDLRAGLVRFVGDPDARIAEDRLRILRLFRFQAWYGRRPLPEGHLEAVARARRGVTDLSVERIGNEMRRLVLAPGAATALIDMQETGVLPLVLAGVGYLSAFGRMVAFEQAADEPATLTRRLATLTRRLAALSQRVSEDVDRVGARLALSRAEQRACLAAVEAASDVRDVSSADSLRRHLFAHGREALRDGLALAAAWSGGRTDVHRRLFEAAEHEAVPVFPLAGRDVVACGVPPGPTVGAMLDALRSWWIARDFEPDEEALRSRLQELAAGAQ